MEQEKTLLDIIQEIADFLKMKQPDEELKNDLIKKVEAVLKTKDTKPDIEVLNGILEKMGYA